ncbi:MAG TPA: type II toxin-antitoxin system VapC family toxin [Candidatus Kapabacteria bacterium]|nr:type II toxin-antitoxin system VapC family toxin [Candidatus Kapabacteria bacterium]
MKYLLDTHSYIWYVEDDKQLSRNALNIIDNPDNELYLSIVSIWEITIKSSLNKLNLKQSISNIYDELNKLNIEILSLEKKNFEILYNLEFFHRDPFDRMIISQAITENLPIISKDIAFNNYKIERIW